MKNTVYGLFQKTVKSNTDNIAIIENYRKTKRYIRDKLEYMPLC